MRKFVGGRFGLRALRAGAKSSPADFEKEGEAKRNPEAPVCPHGSRSCPHNKVGAVFLEVGWNGASEVLEIWDISQSSLANDSDKALARH
jgi:hypothetical protein